jgi:hypothetical protein
VIALGRGATLSHRMSTESPRPPPFYCPACGQKHRADLSALQARADAVAKLACSRCEVVMALQLGADGLPKCEMNEPRGVPMSQPDVKKPSLLIPLAVAVVAAAVVSFAVVSATKSNPAPVAKEDPRIAALEQTVKDLRGEVGALQGVVRQQAAGKGEAATASQAWRRGTDEAVAALGKTMETLSGQQVKLSTAFLGQQSETKSLNGRIESNYTSVRGLTKRLKAVEGK